MSPVLELVAALGGLTGIAAIVSAIVTARTTARQADVSALAFTCQTLQNTVEALETENRRLYECVERLERGQSDDHAQIADLTGRVQNLQAENKRLRARIADLERENADLRARLNLPPVPPPTGDPPTPTGGNPAPVDIARPETGQGKGGS